MYGVEQGLQYGQNERVEELNIRIQSRQFPDRPLAPNFSARPILTKQSRFPILDRRAPFQEPIRPMEMHNIESNFNPGTRRAPPSGYLHSVDLESGLRNQTVGLQSASQSVYVPSTNSDMYNVVLPNTSGPIAHPSLFSKKELSISAREANARNVNVGKDPFNNHTRFQLRGLC